jgi:NDP-sugar pyrophosphorylase family protein
LKALILAAGLGTRLLPLTADIPKALVRINGVTLLEMAIRRLVAEGFDEIIINVHHHADKVKAFIRENEFNGALIAISDESDRLLDTGGAILKAREFLDGNDPFLVHNVDVISNIDLQAVMNKHMERKGLATLPVMDRKTNRYFLFDTELRLQGWTDISTGEERWVGNPLTDTKKLAFSGIHIISPKIFGLFDMDGRFSIIDTYLRLAARRPVYGSFQEGAVWFDVGKPDQLDAVSVYLSDHPEFPRKP